MNEVGQQLWSILQVDDEGRGVGGVVVVLHLQGPALSVPPLPLTLGVSMAARSNEVTKNVWNAMLSLK